MPFLHLYILTDSHCCQTNANGETRPKHSSLLERKEKGESNRATGFVREREGGRAVKHKREGGGEGEGEKKEGRIKFSSYREKRVGERKEKA